LTEDKRYAIECFFGGRGLINDEGGGS